MFFFWFAKNKQFNRKNGLSGQITPFLLVVMVILLIAAIATINIGRVSLDKTCSANAADAGSLAAASAWASAMNMLTQINRDQIEYWFDLNYYTYGQIYLEANGYIDEAIIYALAASAAAASAYFVSVGSGYSSIICQTIWSPYMQAAILDATATVFCFEASQSVLAFSICIQFMQSLTDSFHEQQWEDYCDARTFMDESYINSRKTGLSYAFSNSCIPPKLSDSQNDTFSAWVSSEGPYNDGTYSWQDKLSQQHTVTATVDLPNIVSYELQHTQGSYSEISDLLDGIISRSQIISGALNSAAVVLGATAGSFMAAFGVNITTYYFLQCCSPSPWGAFCCSAWSSLCYSVLMPMHQSLRLNQGWLVSTLAAIVGVAGATSVYLLQSDNDAALEAWDPDGIQSSISCADVADLMIVKIDGVTLEDNDRWTTTCVATQEHPSSSSGILDTTYPVITSSSRARFDGGNIGMFLDNYDPRIEWTS